MTRSSSAAHRGQTVIEMAHAAQGIKWQQGVACRHAAAATSSTEEICLHWWRWRLKSSTWHALAAKHDDTSAKAASTYDKGTLFVRREQHRGRLRQLRAADVCAELCSRRISYLVRVQNVPQTGTLHHPAFVCTRTSTATLQFTHQSFYARNTHTRFIRITLSVSRRRVASRRRVGSCQSTRTQRGAQTASFSAMSRACRRPRWRNISVLAHSPSRRRTERERLGCRASTSPRMRGDVVGCFAQLIGSPRQLCLHCLSIQPHLNQRTVAPTPSSSDIIIAIILIFFHHMARRNPDESFWKARAFAEKVSDLSTRSCVDAIRTVEPWVSRRHTRTVYAGQS